MEAVVVLFVGEQVLVKEGNALSRDLESGDVHDFLGVEVRDELVSVGSHFLDVCLELPFRLTNGLQ